MRVLVSPRLCRQLFIFYFLNIGRLVLKWTHLWLRDGGLSLNIQISFVVFFYESSACLLDHIWKTDPASFQPCMWCVGVQPANSLTGRSLKTKGVSSEQCSGSGAGPGAQPRFSDQVWLPRCLALPDVGALSLSFLRGKRAEPKRANPLPCPHDNPGVFDNSYPLSSSPPPTVSHITSFLVPPALLSPSDALQFVCCFLYSA